MWPPPADERIELDVRGDIWEVSWGRHDDCGTPAFWIDQTIHRDYIEGIPTGDLKSAVVWGLLHGHQVKHEAGNAFWEQVVKLLDEDPVPSTAAVKSVLRQPIAGVGRYRWPQRAAYISNALDQIAASPPPDNPAGRISYLEGLWQVGPKTARLIESGFKGLDAEVCVCDIWIERTLRRIGIFRKSWNVDRHYDRFKVS